MDRLTSPRLIGAILGLYAIWYTHVALAPITHQSRVKQIDNAFMLALLNTESGQRGYLLTGDPLFLKQYYAGLELLKDLEPLYRDVLVDKRSQSSYDQLLGLLKLKKSEMALTIKVRDEKGFPSALSIVRNKVGLGYTAQIQDLRMAIRRGETGRFHALEFWRFSSYRGN